MAEELVVSEAQREAPRLISVIIPVLNGEEHLEQQLAALVSQTYSGRWEIVVADNGCTDGTLALVERWRPQLPPLRVADATKSRGINHARNVGAAAARGDFLAFCDADDVVTPGWLEALADAAPSADIVDGTLDLESLNGDAFVPPPGETPGALYVEHDFLPAVSGGNCGMWATVARDLRWDEAFTLGSSDIEFSWRAAMASLRMAVAPNAVVRKRHRRRLGDLARQWWNYGLSDVQLYRRFRAAGMPRRGAGHAVREWIWLGLHARDLLQYRSRRYWISQAARNAGRIRGSIRYRVLFL